MLHRLLRQFGRIRGVMSAMCVVATVLAAATPSAGGVLMFDDFEHLAASSGDLTLSDDSARTSFTHLRLESALADTCARTQLRVKQGSAGVVVRWDVRQPAPHGYFGMIRADGTALLGWAGGDWPVLRETATGLDPIRNDVVLQLEALGNQVKLWTWAEKMPIPDKPTLTMTDDSVAAGSVALGAISLEFPSRGPIESMFRYVHVADMHVPEPAAAILAAYSLVAMMLRPAGAHRDWARR